MEHFEILNLNNPITIKDILLVFFITMIGIPVIYLKTGKRIKLLIQLFFIFFILVAVFTPIFVAYVFSIYTFNQILLSNIGIIPESLYKVDYKDIRIATNVLPLSCAVWFITSLVIVIKLGKSYKD